MKRDNDVDKPVARHFNTANYSISDIKVCAILPISGSLTKDKNVGFLYRKGHIFLLFYLILTIVSRHGAIAAHEIPQKWKTLTKERFVFNEKSTYYKIIVLT